VAGAALMSCPACGAGNLPGARFCGACGLGLVAPAAEHRKIVTMLFCDLVGSTALGESTDPEAVRVVLARYFERMGEIVESHGGTVEKFIGDAVMAVFGVPQVHEDDALRACRAAVAMRDALQELGIQGRVGVNTGEVVTGADKRLAIGDAVNVAARLEQSAAPDEILVGETTMALLRGAVEVEPVDPLVLKGKTEPVAAFRLVSIVGAPWLTRESRFVGRSGERAMIETAWQRVRAEGRCELVTVVGEAGVGKSRLVAEALAGTEARVVQGRCLPYGEGITYWPVVEVVKQLDVMPADPVAAAAIHSIIGEGEQGFSAEEIAWAFRKLLEENAPAVVVFDDIHWGEDTLLDLVEGAALLASEATLLLVCMARPELLDRRPRWPIGLWLEPLSEQDVAELIGDHVPNELRERIAHAAGGNPLFILEMLAMAEQARGEIVVPPTLRALLAARLDQLDEPERRVLERAAVEGEVFHRGAVQALIPEEQHLTHRLAALVHRGLIRREPAQLPGEDGFRFRHLLIRDAAYEALPKAARADLHRRFAAWLQEHEQTQAELDEIVGYHLEQVTRYLDELGRSDPQLAVAAGTRLGVAGRRALWRGDFRAAETLLERALALTRPYRLDVNLELDLARAAAGTDEAAAAAIATATTERARAAGDAPGKALACTVAAAHRLQLAATGAAGELEASAARALDLLDPRDDDALVHVWWARARLANQRGRYGDMEHAAEQQLRHTHGQHNWGLFNLPVALVHGPRPAEEALRTLDRHLRSESNPTALLYRAWLLAMLDRFDEAWPLARRADAHLRELTRYGDEEVLAAIAHLEGDEEATAQHLRSYCDQLAAHGSRGTLSTYAPLLGRSLFALGRHEEVEALARHGRELGDPQDACTQALWRQVLALVQAHHDPQQAEQLAREAVAICETTDALQWQGDALSDLAEVLQAAGRHDGAIASLREARDRYDRKQIIPLARRTRERLAALEPAHA
jgi:class 3 adenylate cyclase/tetratricopeptide (TPR) repeat protein